MRIRALRPASVLVIGAALASIALAQRIERPGGGERVRPPESIPANESYAPLTTSVFKVLSVRRSDRVIRVLGADGRTADVRVAEHVYDVAKLKSGDAIRVDFFQPDNGDVTLRAAGVWPAY
jgi:hypothetical protein